MPPLFRIPFFIYLFLFACICCSSSFLRKESIEKFNEKTAKKGFVARKDIFAAFADKSQPKEILFSKGEKLRIVVEQSKDWLKVRAFPALTNREQSRGRLILFISSELMGAEEIKNYSLANLQKKLNDLLKEIP